MDVGKAENTALQSSTNHPDFSCHFSRNYRNAATSMSSMGFNVADLLRMSLGCAAPPLRMPRTGVLRGCCVLSATPKVMPGFDFGETLHRGGTFVCVDCFPSPAGSTDSHQDPQAIRGLSIIMIKDDTE